MTGAPPDSWRSVYDEAVRRADLDTVHDLIARYGPEVLERGLPYVLVAARNRARDLHRQAARRQDRTLDGLDPPESLDAEDDARTALRLTGLSSKLIQALGELSEPDAVLLWEGARGSSDSAIALEFVERGWDLTPASRATIRKRRERATARLRQAFRSRGADETSATTDT